MCKLCMFVPELCASRFGDGISQQGQVLRDLPPLVWVLFRSNMHFEPGGNGFWVRCLRNICICKELALEGESQT